MNEKGAKSPLFQVSSPWLSYRQPANVHFTLQRRNSRVKGRMRRKQIPDRGQLAPRHEPGVDLFLSGEGRGALELAERGDHGVLAGEGGADGVGVEFAAP